MRPFLSDSLCFRKAPKAALSTRATAGESDRSTNPWRPPVSAERRVAKPNKANHHHRPGRRLRNRRCQNAAADGERTGMTSSCYLGGIVARAQHLAEASKIKAGRTDRWEECERHGLLEIYPFEELQDSRSVHSFVVNHDGRRKGCVR